MLSQGSHSESPITFLLLLTSKSSWKNGIKRSAYFGAKSFFKFVHSLKVNDHFP